MRKYKKKQIQNSLDEILHAQKLVMQFLLTGSAEEARNLLTGCQEAVIAAGNAIEETEAGTAPGDAVIGRIEAYCELVYELWQKAGELSAASGKRHALREGTVLSGQAGIRLKEACDKLQELDQAIHDIKEHIQADLPERLEIAFLPYKASMWDCLESVWEAAAADPDCEAYVVPIPYLDRGPDDTFTDIHCEADKFPKNVPVVSWQEYDIAARHPDVIYIHNPYDNVNNVTSVHPSFYAKELKKHTDMLVYIPYFVCTNDHIEDHFCVLPGTIFADRVIVQSETVRQAYIEAYHKFEKENHIEGYVGNAEEKFVALGSPKYDKVLKTTRENVEIPDDWRRKITNSDGSFKKVIFYNTTVTQILEHREKVLEKIRSVFDLLQKRDDVVLLWRPHPLSLTTCRSVSAQLTEEYRALTEEYRAQDWGIYDDTADLHRAIALSDAYYGDMSSVVELYRMTGKPIMIEDVELV